MKRQKQVGIGLILLGILILLDQLQVLSLTGKNLIVVVALLLGGLLVRKSLNDPLRKGLLAGSFFIIWGILSLTLNYAPQLEKRILFWGEVFLSLGLANLIYFVFSSLKKSLNFLSFVLYSAIGITMIAAYYDKIDIWRLEEILDNYWPVILILFGIFILLDSYRGEQKRKQNEPESMDLPGEK